MQPWHGLYWHPGLQPPSLPSLSTRGWPIEVNLSETLAVGSRMGVCEGCGLSGGSGRGRQGTVKTVTKTVCIRCNCKCIICTLMQRWLLYIFSIEIFQGPWIVQLNWEATSCCQGCTHIGPPPPLLLPFLLGPSPGPDTGHRREGRRERKRDITVFLLNSPPPPSPRQERQHSDIGMSCRH